MHDPINIRDWIDAVRIDVRRGGPLLEPTFSAGHRAGLLLAARQIEALLDRLETAQ